MAKKTVPNALRGQLMLQKALDARMVFLTCGKTFVVVADRRSESLANEILKCVGDVAFAYSAWLREKA